MPPLTISTVIPTYQRASLVERAIRSAVAECRPGDEVLVVDDGSTDDTEGRVRAFGPPVRYLRTAHAGAGAARNAGVRESGGDLIAFLDSDDEWMPGKLAWQRAVMERFPDVLMLFSDFARVRLSGAREHHCIREWFGDRRPWDEILGPGEPSEAIPGLPPSAPPFRVHVGRLYEHYLRNWSVSTITVVVRRAPAGDALHFAEDVGTYEDLECYARLAARGLAGYMDCETAWIRHHTGPKLTGADAVVAADAATTIIARVWGADGAFLRAHRSEYEAVMDGFRERKVRELLVRGAGADARREVARMFRPRRSLYWLSRLPGSAVKALLDVRRAVRAAGRAPAGAAR